MHTILGAGGAIGTELAKVLQEQNQPMRLVSRNPKPFGNAELVAADISDATQTADAVKGSSIVYLTAGLTYDIKVWRKLWPAIMQNAIDACKKHNAKLIFFDNVYALGKVVGPMTEESPLNPCSNKGEIRAQLVTMLMNEVKAGNIIAMIARAADFYGPDCKTSVFNSLVTDKMATGKKAQWLIDAKPKHSFTYTPDCGRALWLLSQNQNAWNQVWNLPTAHPALTGKEMIEHSANEFGVKPGFMIISKFMCKLLGLFNTTIKELGEMTYQNDSDYIFDSSKIEKAFGITPTSYQDGIKALAQSKRP
jgi:nucleoside-diphosphate-sugar epimerase